MPATQFSPRVQGATRPASVPAYATLTPREQAILARIHALQDQGQDVRTIARTISKEFNNCTLEGVIKRYITGISSCEPLPY
jgi:hypothetical protein